MKLLAVLTISLSALAMAQPKLSDKHGIPKECRKGPRAWCADKALAERCGKMKFYETRCESRSPGPHAGPQPRRPGWW